MNKEQVYDNQISPLLKQVIEICQQSDISMIASFSIPTDEHPDLACTTSLNGNESDQLHDAFGRCVNIIKQPAPSFLLKVSR